MILDPEYKSVTIKRHDPTAAGALVNILSNILAADGRRPKLDFTLSSAASPQFSNSHSVSLEIPGLRAGTALDRTMVRCMHGELPPSVIARVAREAAWSSDATAPGAVDPFLAIPAADKIDRVFADHNTPFYIDHNTVTGTAGVLKFNFNHANAAGISPYDYKDDEGNSGILIYEIDVPYTLASQSGRAAETALETVNTGATLVFVRPADGDPAAPFPWRMIGCLQSEVSKKFQYDYSQTMKGYNELIVGKTIKKQLTDLDCQSVGDTLYLRSIIDAANIEDLGHAHKITPRFGGSLEEFEVCLQARSSKGRLIICHIPRAYIIHNGDYSEGGKEKYIPFKIEGAEPADYLYLKHLYQTYFVTASLTVI